MRTYPSATAAPVAYETTIATSGETLSVATSATTAQTPHATIASNPYASAVDTTPDTAAPTDKNHAASSPTTPDRETELLLGRLHGSSTASLQVERSRHADGGISKGVARDPRGMWGFVRRLLSVSTLFVILGAYIVLSAGAIAFLDLGPVLGFAAFVTLGVAVVAIGVLGAYVRWLRKEVADLNSPPPEWERRDAVDDDE